MTRAKRWRYAWHFGIGAVILVLARPFEGSVILIPALITLGIAKPVCARVAINPTHRRSGRFLVCL
jgi:hypothetical protein